MSNIKQNIVWPGSGMDSDSDYRYMTTGDSPLRRNILVGEDAANGLLVNMLGNTRTVDISDHELYLSHYYKVIGSYYNRLTRKIYYFVFSQPYEITTAGGGTSTTTTTTTEAGSGSLDIDYTAGSFQYDNMLLCYWEDTQELDVIFRDPKNYFGLHWDYPMRDIVMIGDILYFNPRVSEPKMIDVVRAYNYTNYDAYDATATYVYGDYVTYFGGLFRANVAVAAGETPVTTEAKWDRIGDSYQNETFLSGFDSEFRYAFNVIKQPPIVRPSVAYGTDTAINSNNVRGKVFRFSYRYKYFDNSYSVYSAYSDVSLPTDDETWNGEYLADVQSNNYISVAINLHSAALIKSVEIVFQVIGENWRRCKIVNRQEQVELTTRDFYYNFYNNEAYEIYADNTIVTKVYDSMPKLANAQELINKNILCYGGVTEGFDNIPKEDIDVTLTPEIEAIIQIPDIDNIIRDNNPTDFYWPDPVIDDSYQYQQIISYIAIEVPDDPVATWGLQSGDVYRLVVNGAEGIVVLLAGDILTGETLVNAMADAIKASYAWGDLSHDTDGELWIGQNDVPPDVSVSYIYRPSGDTTAITKQKGFKTGSFHPFCIFYYDMNLRRWDAQTSKISENSIGYTYEGTTVYVPTFTEMSPGYDTANRWVIDWTVNHLPPEGARYWRWGYAGNSLCSWFVQYIIHDIGHITTEFGGYITYIDISPLQTLTNTTYSEGGTLWNQFPASKISPYEWQKGDRIRFLTAEGDQATPDADLGDPLGALYDFEIIKQDVDDNRIYIQRFDYTFPNVGECSLVEIYRPIKEVEKETFYEFGALMPIIEDSLGVKVHGGANLPNVANQETSTDTPASGRFNEGDVYHIVRTPSKYLDVADTDQGVFHESMWWSDYYDSSDWSRGKAGIESNFGELYLNIIRYSNPFFQNTQINGLNTFEYDSYKELNDIFGRIIAIYELGDTLKCYQERKASSILIGRTEYYQAAEGQTTVALSSVVLGSIRYSTTNFSTVFPESIMRNNRYIYGFDIYNGVMWRDSANGIFPISGRYADAGGETNYKMATYFKNKSKALLVSGISHCDVMSVWDENYKNLHVVFKDYDEELNDEAVVFHEPSNRWICFQDLDQTPPSHNVIVECNTYTITKGFPGGLGYWFDEDTRFAMFDIVAGGGSTTGESFTFAPLLIETIDPTIILDSYPVEDDIQLVLAPQQPYLTVTYIDQTDLLNDLATWDGDEGGSGVAKSITWDISKTVYYEASTTFYADEIATLTAKPSWLTVMDGTLHSIGVGQTVVDGETILIYPTNVNDGIDDNDVLTFTDSYGNTCTITCVHYASASAVVVTSSVIGNEFIISNWSYTAPLGSTSLSISFNHDFEGNQYKKITVTDATLNVLYVGTGTSEPSGILVRLAHLSSKTMTLSRAMVSGDVLLVTIGEEDNTASEDLAVLYIEALDPVVSIKDTSLSVASVSWTAAQYGTSVKLSTVAITTESSVTVTAIPNASWAEATLDQIHPLIVGDTLEDDDIVYLYPLSANAGVLRTTTFTIEDAYGNSGTCTLSQDAPITPPVIIVQIDPLEANGMTISTASGTGVDGSATVNITFTPSHPDWGTGDVYFVWWRAIRSSIEIGDNRITANDDVPFTGNISLDTTISSGQTIYIYIGSDIY